jgi:hypothetical protein
MRTRGCKFFKIQECGGSGVAALTLREGLRRKVLSYGRAKRNTSVAEGLSREKCKAVILWMSKSGLFSVLSCGLHLKWCRAGG